MKAQSLHDGILALRRRTLAIGAAAAALYGLLAALAVLVACITAGLAQLAVERAAELAAKVSAATAAPLRPLARPGLVLGVTFAALGIVALVAPRLLSTQILRFADPFGDHPPYSRIVFTV